MARLNQDNGEYYGKRPPVTINQPPDPAGLIINLLLAPWVRQHGALPAPCPQNLDDCARWWLDVMQEPEGPKETYQVACVGGGLRWETMYANRCRAALFGFLSATSLRDRELIVRLVTQDRIPYRGDPIGQFIEIASETEIMRDDPVAYKRNAIARAKAALSGIRRAA